MKREGNPLLSARELQELAGDLVESLERRLKDLRALHNAEVEAIMAECERAIAEVRAELDSLR